MLGQRAQRHQQDDEDDDEPDDPPAGAVAPARRRVSGEVAGDAHGGEPNVRFPGAKGRHREVGTARDVQVSRRRCHEAAAARVGRRDGRGRSGTPRPRCTAPASALSSQSEHPLGDVTTQRSLPSAADRHHARRERLRGVVAGQALDPFAAPFAVGRADPVAGVAASVCDLAPQHGHDHVGQPGRRLLDRVVVGHAAAPAPPNAAPAANASLSCPRRRRRRLHVLGLVPEQVVGRQRRRAAQSVEQPVLVVAQGALDRAARAAPSPGRAARRAGR